MLNEVYTMDWPAISAELMRKSLNEKLEAIFLHSKNRQFVKVTEQKNTPKECCVDDTMNEPDEIR